MQLLTQAIVVSVSSLVLLIAFILLRRWYRSRYFARRDARVYALRQRWDEIVEGIVPAEQWRSNPLDREIVETILLDSMEVAADAELARLLNCLRASGLLEQRITEARNTKRSKRKAALVALGRTRAPECIPALVEALDDADMELRTAAVRGLGRTGLPEAAGPMLDRFGAGQLSVPMVPLENALLSCCRHRPDMLITSLRLSEGSVRDLIARVLGELVTPEMGDDLAILAGDSSPEVRASACRALAHCPTNLALPVVTKLTMDEVWFVRLRAVAALGQFDSPEIIEPLVRCLCDTSRLVRQKSAAALTRLHPHLAEIIKQVVDTSDKYALHAFLSELHRADVYPQLLELLNIHDSGREDAQDSWVKPTHAGS